MKLFQKVDGYLTDYCCEVLTNVAQIMMLVSIPVFVLGVMSAIFMATFYGCWVGTISAIMMITFFVAHIVGMYGGMSLYFYATSNEKKYPD